MMQKKDIQVILTDLDGTLLDVDMDFFIPAYLEEMRRYGVAQGFIPENSNLVPLVYEGTAAMFQHTDTSRTNKQVFMERFFQDGWFAQRKEAAMAFFDRFYEDVFPHLGHLCRRFSFSQAVAEAMFATGLPVVLATSPVFPMSAIDARLEWAGVKDFPWLFKTAYENVHTCKPRTAYYQEIAAMTGVQPENCLMIGNDTLDDLSAGKIGMTTFLLEEAVLDRAKGANQPDYHGKAAELIAFLKKIRKA